MAQTFKRADLSQIRYEPIEGEIMQNTIDDKFYIYHENQWKEIKMDSSGFEMGLYDMNKQIISQLPTLTDLERAENIINNAHTNWSNDYYMLYGKEISYFTVLLVKDATLFGEIVIDCIKNIGDVKAIDLTETNDAIEIWVMYNDEPTCLYLFPYDGGIVQVGECDEKDLLRTTYVRP